jgi:hypothetical protein
VMSGLLGVVVLDGGGVGGVGVRQHHAV